MKKMKTIIFDFDGTLIKSENIKSNIFREIFYEIYKKKKNVKKVYNSLIGKTNLEKKIEIIITEIIKLKPNKKEINKFKKIFSQKYKERLSTCPIISCIHLLNYIKLNTKYLFVVSLHERNDVKSILKHCNLNKFFTSIYGGPLSKKENITFIMKKYKLNNNEILYIGDTENDITISKKMKIKSIGVNKKLNKRKILKEIGAIEAYKDVCKIPFGKIIPENKCK
jgi:phosphoglycolate phosphatase-like HAD superfamily hydrolase